jgi:hypothetical protein
MLEEGALAGINISGSRARRLAASRKYTHSHAQYGPALAELASGIHTKDPIRRNQSAQKSDSLQNEMKSGA